MEGKHIMDNVYSDMQPTDPQNDVKGTGKCELWNRQVDLIRPPPDKRQHMTVSNTAHLAKCHK